MTDLPWTCSWPEDRRRVDDGHVPRRALKDEHDVLRVFQVVGGARKGLWFWISYRFLSTGPDGMLRFVNRDGFCASKELAQAAAEQAYFKATH